MSILHIANTFFEWELIGKAPPTLDLAMTMNKTVKDLQTLPKLYASQNDEIYVAPYQPKDICEIRSWGYSLLIQEFAKKHKIPYSMPPWEVIQQVNSKAFSFSLSPLPGARLLEKGDRIPQHHLLKTCFGTAGRGHMRTDQPKALLFCEREWDAGRPVLCEPLLEIHAEFSTQWELGRDGTPLFLGHVTTTASPHGAHQVARASDDVPHLHKHMVHVHMALKKISDLGYFGPIGFDAILCGDNQLQPISEINARRTMGWVALEYKRVHKLPGIIEVAYDPSVGLSCSHE